jgi:hypothetical protein
MYDPDNNKFVPADSGTPSQQRDWTKFSEGDTVRIKDVLFRVHEVGESRLVLKPVKQ